MYIPKKGESVEIGVRNGKILVGQIIRIPKDYGPATVGEHEIYPVPSWGLIGKIKNTDDKVADWSINIDQISNIKPINNIPS